MSPKPKLVGYMRVSTDDQSHDLQMDALLKAGCNPDFICSDKISGAKMKRPGLERALRLSYPGDTIVVWKLDRLGRSVAGVLEAIAEFEERGISLRSIQETFDSSTPFGRAMMQIILVFAEMERNMIAERTRAGIKAYQARGGKMGQKHTVLDFPKRLKKFTELYTTGELFAMTGKEVRAAMIKADPKGKIPEGISWYFNWKSSDFKGFVKPIDETLEVDDE